jgi:hypothetical protein
MLTLPTGLNAKTAVAPAFVQLKREASGRWLAERDILLVR